MDATEQAAFARCYDLLGEIEQYREVCGMYPTLEIYHGPYIVLREAPDYAPVALMHNDDTEWNTWAGAAKGLEALLHRMRNWHTRPGQEV